MLKCGSKDLITTRLFYIWKCYTYKHRINSMKLPHCDTDSQKHCRIFPKMFIQQSYIALTTYGYNNSS